MQIPEQYRRAEELERYLGAPTNPSNPFSFEQVVELDEREQYPEQACALLGGWGYSEYFIPVSSGGKLDSFERLFSIIRVTARRDMTVGVTQAMTFIASSVAWVSATDRQKRQLASVIKGGCAVAIGLHEKSHGNDLLACELEARRDREGFRLSGEKWSIGNPQRAAAIIVFARTNSNGGLRGFSLFLLEKKDLARGAYSYLPKLKTHGIRGHEVAGIRFHDCFVPASAMIGNEGAGLEIALKASQLTRAILPAASLGGADTALRAVLDFALSRGIYGRSAFEIPYTQSALVGVFLDLLVCDCLAICAARSLHAATDQMSVRAAVAKYFIPATIERLVAELAVVLGARYYLREGHWWGIFQKIARDVPATSIGHYSLTISLSHLAAQLQQLAMRRARSERPHDEQMRANLEAVFSLDAPLPAFDASRLCLSCHGRDDMIDGLELELSRLREMKGAGDAERESLNQIVALASEVVQELKQMDRTLAELASRSGPGFNKSPEIFELAKRYCILHASSACLQMWAQNRASLGGFFADGHWLILCLERMLARLRPARPPARPSYWKSVEQELVRLHKEEKLFSIIPLQLAQAEEA